MVIAESCDRAKFSVFRLFVERKINLHTFPWLGIFSKGHAYR